jgi:hypothetical protein
LGATGQQIQAWGTEHFADLVIPTDGAFNLSLTSLGLERLLRRKPALEVVLVVALKVEDFHTSIMA